MASPIVKDFSLPDVGEGIAEAEIVRWLVREGDSVAEDQDLVEIETDKALVTLPSPYTGRVVKLHATEGETVKVGEPLVSVEEKPGTTIAEIPEKREPRSVVGSLDEAREDTATPSIEAIPSVRRMAQELGVDLNLVRGTGPGGRVTREDVEKAAGKAPVPHGREETVYGPVERVILRGIRRTVARRMAEASKRVADVTLWEDADITELEKIRKRENKTAEEKGIKLTYLPFLIKAVIPALKAHPYLNASLDDQAGVIILKKYYNMGIAVDTPNGLMVFVIKEADRKKLLDLAIETTTLAEKARLRTLSLSELRGSTFTITNYGVIGASYGTPIINYPEVAILGLGKIEDRPVVRQGKIVVRRMMPLSLVFDHRVIDGVEAGRFLRMIIQHLEDQNLSMAEDK